MFSYDCRAGVPLLNSQIKSRKFREGRNQKVKVEGTLTTFLIFRNCLLVDLLAKKVKSSGLCNNETQKNVEKK